MKLTPVTIGGVQYNARPLNIIGYFAAGPFLRDLSAQQDQGLATPVVANALCEILSLSLKRDDSTKTAEWVADNLRLPEYTAAYTAVADLLEASGFVKKERVEGQDPALGEDGQTKTGAP